MSDGEIFVISCIKHRDLAFLRYHKFSRDTSTIMTHEIVQIERRTDPAQ